jgi:hypothetical protein
LGQLDLTDDEVAKIREIHKDFRPKIEKALRELQGLLTDDQKKARQEALRAGKRRREVLEALKLTDEQKQKVPARQRLSARSARSARCPPIVPQTGAPREDFHHVRIFVVTSTRASLVPSSRPPPHASPSGTAVP